MDWSSRKNHENCCFWSEKIFCGTPLTLDIFPINSQKLHISGFSIQVQYIWKIKRKRRIFGDHLGYLSISFDEEAKVRKFFAFFQKNWYIFQKFQQYGPISLQNNKTLLDLKSTTVRDPKNPKIWSKITKKNTYFWFLCSSLEQKWRWSPKFSDWKKNS